MQFLWSWTLPLLVLVPLLAAAYVWSLRRRAKFALRYSSLTLVKEAMVTRRRVRRHIPPLLVILALAAMLLASARPTVAWAVPQQQTTVILTIDVSASMVTRDIAPNRLEAAKEAARAFVDHLPEPRPKVGIVAFSDSSFVVQAPTYDRQAILAAISQLQTRTTTAIGSAILGSLQAIAAESATPPPSGASAEAPLLPAGDYPGAAVVLLTDGQSDVGPSPIDAAEEASRHGVRIYTVGIGTAQGNTPPNVQGSIDYLDEDTLRQIATITGSKYFHAVDEGTLAAVYSNLGAMSIVKTQVTEITPAFISLGIVLGLIGHVLGYLWSGRLP